MSNPTLSGWSTVCLIPFQAVNVRYMDRAHAIVDLSLLTSAWWTATKTDLTDVRFTDRYGTVLPYYRITFNRSAKTGSALVLLPTSVPENGYVTLWAFSGNAGATDGSGFASVAARLPDPYEVDAELVRCRCADGDNTPGNLSNQLWNESPTQSHLTLHGTYNWTTRTQPGYAGLVAGFSTSMPAVTLGAGSGYITADPTLGYFTPNDALTFAAWVWIEGTISAFNFLWMIGYTDNSQQEYFAINNVGKLCGNVNAGTGAQFVAATDLTVPTGQWVCLGGTMSVDGLDLWVNNVKSSQSSTTPARVNNQVGWPVRGMVFGGDNRSSSTPTANATSMTWGPIIVSRSKWTPEEWDGFYKFYNPVQIRPRRKIRYKGIPFKLSSDLGEGVNFQESSIVDTPSDPDGYRYTIVHSSGGNSTNNRRELRKTNDLLYGPYKNYGLTTARTTTFHSTAYSESGVLYEIVADYGNNNDVLLYSSTDGGHTWSGSTKIVDHTVLTINGMNAATIVNPQISKPAFSPLGPYILGFSGRLTTGGQWGQWFATAATITGPYTMLNSGNSVDMTLGQGQANTSVNYRHELFYDAGSGKYYAMYGLASLGATPAMAAIAQSADLVTWTAANAESRIGIDLDRSTAIDQIGDPFPKEFVSPIGLQTNLAVLANSLDNGFGRNDGFRAFAALYHYRGTFKQYVFDGSFTQLSSPVSADSTPYDPSLPLGASGSAITATDITNIANGILNTVMTAPTGPATTIGGAITQLWRRFFKKSTITNSQLKTLADDGTTAVTTQTLSDDGTTRTQGTAA